MYLGYGRGSHNSPKFSHFIFMYILKLYLYIYILFILSLKLYLYFYLQLILEITSTTSVYFILGNFLHLMIFFMVIL